MGEDDERHENNTLKRPYWIGRFPVTQAQFQQFMDAEGYQKSRILDRGHTAKMSGANQVKSTTIPWWVGASAPYRFGEPSDLANHPVVGVGTGMKCRLLPAG